MDLADSIKRLRAAHKNPMLDETTYDYADLSIQTINQLVELVEEMSERSDEHCQTIRLNGCDMMNDRAYSALTKADALLTELGDV